jgi:hypothetical protein
LTVGNGTTSGNIIQVNTSSTQTDQVNIVSSGGYEMMLLPDIGASDYNTITQNHDSGIIYGKTSGAGNAHGFVIAPWSSGSGGVRMDGSGNTTISNLYLPTSGGTASPLNYYEEYFNNTYTLAGPWGANAVFCVVYLVRLGRIVHIGITSTTGSSTSTSTNIYVTGNLPSRFCPSITQWYIPMIVINNNTYVCGNATISSGGTFYIYLTGGATYTGTCGINYSTASWIIE